MPKTKRKIGKQLPKPAATFRIYPDPSRTLYLRVRVWKNKGDMLYAGRVDAEAVGRTWNGMCCGLTCRRVYADGRVETKPIFADMFLHRRALSGRVLAHESTHAAMRFMKRIGFDALPSSRENNTPLTPREEQDDPEEVLAYAVGEIMRQLIDRLSRAGFYD
jgi:hypothetical protein